MTDSETAAAAPARSRWPLAVSVLAGVAVFVLLAVAGYLYAQSLDDEWSARASALVLPAKPVNPDFVPSYYETLSRGQMVSTLAELIRLEEFEEQVATGYRLTGEQRNAVAISVSVVADTAMLQVVATSPDPNLAIAMADGVVDAATVYVGDLGLPYALVPVGSAENSLGESGPSTMVAIVAFSLVALVIALAYQQGILRLARLLARRRTDRISEPAIVDSDEHEAASLESDGTAGEPPLEPAADGGEVAVEYDDGDGDEASDGDGDESSDGDSTDGDEDSDESVTDEALPEEPVGVPPAAV